MLGAALRLLCVPPPRWPMLITFVPPGAHGVWPELQKCPPPSTYTRRRHSSEHGQHRVRQPGPGTARSTTSAHARTPQPSPKLAPAVRCTGALPAHPTARRATALPSGWISGGLTLAVPPRRRAAPPGPALQGPRCSLGSIGEWRLRAPLRTLDGRARSPLNGRVDPPVCYGRRARRLRDRQRTSGEGRGGRAGGLSRVHGRCALVQNGGPTCGPTPFISKKCNVRSYATTCNRVIMTHP